jgi:hypothetical protein
MFTHTPLYPEAELRGILLIKTLYVSTLSFFRIIFPHATEWLIYAPVDIGHSKYLDYYTLLS